MNILEMLQSWENSKLEFKEDIWNNDSIAWEIVSFLNANWWIIIFWVSDNWKIKWVEKINIFEEKIANISRNNIFPEVILDFEIQKIDKKDIFILKIPIWKNKPYEVKTTRKKYIRVQTTKREVSREEEIRLWQASWNLKYDNILLQDSNIDEIDIKKVEQFIRKIYNKKLDETWIDYETLLQNLDICKKWIDDILHPTFSWLYFFWKSEFLRKRINSSYIIFAYFKWDNIGGSEILDKKEIEWTFDEIYDDTIKFIHKYNAEYRNIKWYKSKIKYDYPLEAIRETLMNAMLHRDYTYIWANIRIFMFDNRLEIISPWVLPNWLTLKALESWIYQRFTRNEYIINFASKYFSDVAESLWSWVNRIKEICKKWWYTYPTYLLTENELRVIYYKNEGVNLENEGVNLENEGVNLENEGVNLEKFIIKNPWLRISQISEMLNIPKKTLERWVKKLKDEWKIEFIWSTKTWGYFIK
jgi:ATP-dependent DNA helicase RecG